MPWGFRKHKCKIWEHFDIFDNCPAGLILGKTKLIQCDLYVIVNKIHIMRELFLNKSKMMSEVFYTNQHYRFISNSVYLGVQILNYLFTLWFRHSFGFKNIFKKLMWATYDNLLLINTWRYSDHVIPTSRWWHGTIQVQIFISAKKQN